MFKMEQIAQSHIRYNIQLGGVEWINVYWSGHRCWSYNLNDCLSHMKIQQKHLY